MKTRMLQSDELNTKIYGEFHIIIYKCLEIRKKIRIFASLKAEANKSLQRLLVRCNEIYPNNSMLILLTYKYKTKDEN